jgi:hypothetical protein|tara:strand:- start:1729 stop:2430 length:702 start_codon:yes stop_codon:yes gene_type:complete
LRLVIHQPNFLPYVGFFHKLSLADTFVMMDNTQYDKKFTNRNKIKIPDGWSWLTVPINKEHKFLPNKLVEINNKENWKEMHWKKITRSYTNSKFFKKNYKSFFEEVYNKEWKFLFELNSELLRQIIDWLGLKIQIIKESELNINGNSTERLVNVCKELGAETYVSGVGGKEYMNEKLFQKNNIKIEYQKFQCPTYTQIFGGDFIPNLSIIDLLFNNGSKSLPILTDDTNCGVE